jgi:REP element-mobilizing transposase RayT
VAETTCETIKELNSERAIICVSDMHVHVLMELGGKELVSRFCQLAKGRSSRKLTSAGLAGKVWARGYHARHIDTASWDSAEKYIIEHKTGREVFRRIQ